jgi:hypothetical protein
MQNITESSQRYLVSNSEPIAKFLSFFITTLFFILFSFFWNDKKLNLGSLEIATTLSLFWLVYESLCFLFFLVIVTLQTKKSESIIIANKN